ncbi:MAG: hypothetical protein BHW65_09350 [Verrucomicrobia bacterium CAG:312_58_20]|nr:MAG: hypothetical protein BHW65_09350 [Verrucomicrobia bacterium CAG:312_58_20]
MQPQTGSGARPVRKGGGKNAARAPAKGNAPPWRIAALRADFKSFIRTAPLCKCLPRDPEKIFIFFLHRRGKRVLYANCYLLPD